MRKKNIYLLLIALGILAILDISNNSYSCCAGTERLPANTIKDNHEKSVRDLINNKRFKVEDTTQSIYQSIVNIPIVGGFVPHATGFVVGKDKILTCAHVSSGAKVGKKVIPGLNGENKPFGEFAIKDVATPKEYYTGETTTDQSYDYSVITVLPNDKGEHIGDVVERLSLREITVSDLVTGDPVRLIGYPGDKGGLEMWESPGKLKRSDGYFGDDFLAQLLGPHFLEFDADMVVGNSGSPLLDKDNNVIGFCNLLSENGEGFGNGATMLEPRAKDWIDTQLGI